MSDEQLPSTHTKVSASQILITMRTDSAEETSSSMKLNDDASSNVVANNDTNISNISTATNRDVAYVTTSPSSTQNVHNNNNSPSPSNTKNTLELSPNSSDDEETRNASPEPIIYDDDLIFDKDEDAPSESEDHNDHYLPSTDHYRRIIMNTSTKIPTSNLYTGLFNNQFIPEEFVIPKQWEKSFKSTDNLSGIVNCIMLIRKRAVDRKRKTTSKVDIGFRFPFKQVITPEDRFEMTELASKFYLSNDKKRIPYLWLHYYPPHQNKGNVPVREFFKNSFPSASDNERIDTVHEHNKTECFAIGIHDKHFENLQFGFTDRCHILAAVSFCLLKNNDKNDLSGAYIYYLGIHQ